MKQLVRLLFGLLFFPALLACHATAPLQYLPALRGDYFKHDSVAVGRAFNIYVAYPEDYAKNPEARYPVVYLLDGDSLFPIMRLTTGSCTSTKACPERSSLASPMDRSTLPSISEATISPRRLRMLRASKEERPRSIAF